MTEQEKASTKWTEPCPRCGKPMNPIERMMGEICGECVREKHAEVVAGK